MFLVAVETILRPAGTGCSTRFFPLLRVNGEDCFVQNDRFGWRFLAQFGQVLRQDPGKEIASERVRQIRSAAVATPP